LSSGEVTSRSAGMSRNASQNASQPASAITTYRFATFLEPRWSRSSLSSHGPCRPLWRIPARPNRGDCSERGPTHGAAGLPITRECTRHPAAAFEMARRYDSLHTTSSISRGSVSDAHFACEIGTRRDLSGGRPARSPRRLRSGKIRETQGGDVSMTDTMNGEGPCHILGKG
jgi:hypothetical protein